MEGKSLRKDAKGDKLMVSNGYIRCPFCGVLLQRVPPDMSAVHLPLYCRKDKVEFSVNITNGQIQRDSAVAVESCET